MSDVVRLSLAFSAVVGLSLAGGLLPLAREWSRSTIRLLLAFGTGVLLGAAFFHMIPEAVAVLGRNVGPPVLAGLSPDLRARALHHDASLRGGALLVPSHGARGLLRDHAPLPHRRGEPRGRSHDPEPLGGGHDRHRAAQAPGLRLARGNPPSLRVSAPAHRADDRSVSRSPPRSAALLSFGFLQTLSGPPLFYAIAFSAGTFLAIATADLLPQVPLRARGSLPEPSRALRGDPGDGRSPGRALHDDGHAHEHGEPEAAEPPTATTAHDH